MQAENLIQTLIEQTVHITGQVEKYKSYDMYTLTWRENQTSWNILECLAHLNLYGNFYLPQIENKIKNTSTQADLAFKPGLLGNYFAKAMLPKEKPNKMKTFKNMNTLHTTLDKTVIDTFISQQGKMLALLHEAGNVSLNHVKISTSLSSVIKLKLGDTFRFLINHISRHVNQIDRILKSIKKV